MCTLVMSLNIYGHEKSFQKNNANWWVRLAFTQRVSCWPKQVPPTPDNKKTLRVVNFFWKQFCVIAFGLNSLSLSLANEPLTRLSAESSLFWSTKISHAHDMPPDEVMSSMEMASCLARERAHSFTFWVFLFLSFFRVNRKTMNFLN